MRPKSFLRQAQVLGLMAPVLLTCQDYPFELRLPQRVSARKITEAVATVKPTDILLVLDNSGTMIEERQELKDNVGSFVDQLLERNVDFHLAIITPDIECNVTTRDCDGIGPQSSTACCNLHGSDPLCTDTDTDADTLLDTTTCDGGRLRKHGGGRFFVRPTQAERTAWVTQVQDTLDDLGCAGSAYEASMEAAVVAVACSIGHPDCTNPNVAQLNAGFIRDNADLVVIFVSDEDDCSFRNEAFRYLRPTSNSDINQQTEKLCSQAECYGYYAPDLTSWTSSYFNCVNSPRLVNPPALPPVSTFIDRLVAYKDDGDPSTPDIRRVRAAGILGGVPDASEEQGFRAAGCFQTLAQPSATCGCLTTSPGSDVFCALTEVTGQLTSHLPDTGLPLSLCGGGTVASNGGCEALPGGRYVSFMNELATRRIAAGGQADVLMDSVCRSRYDETLAAIVNNVILSNCFELGEAPTSAANAAVKLNGNALANVEPDAGQEGWSWVPGSTEICLEGGLIKRLDDRFEILFIGED